MCLSNRNAKAKTKTHNPHFTREIRKHLATQVNQIVVLETKECISKSCSLSSSVAAVAAEITFLLLFILLFPIALANGK